MILNFGGSKSKKEQIAWHQAAMGRIPGSRNKEGSTIEVTPVILMMLCG